MIEPDAVDQIIEQYEKHGWKLRRALLSPEGRRALGDKVDTMPVEDSDLDALWFSRQSQPDREAWELRRLTGLPYALVAVIPIEAESDEIDETLAQVADEMRAKTIA